LYVYFSFAQADAIDVYLSSELETYSAVVRVTAPLIWMWFIHVSALPFRPELVVERGESSSPTATSSELTPPKGNTWARIRQGNRSASAPQVFRLVLA
jgi:hypothetical protein